MLKKLFILINIALLCGCVNLENKTLEAIKASEYTFMEKECELNEYFADEPEFYSFAKTEFCRGEITITQLERITESQSIVDYEITFRARHGKLKKWLRAYNQMEVRKLPSPKQQQIKALVEQITTQKRDWKYYRQTVTLKLGEDGWIVQDVIR